MHSSWTKRLNTEMGRKSARTKLTCFVLCLMAFTVGVLYRPSQSRVPEVQVHAQLLRTPLATNALADFRIYPKPDRLCLSAPYNACVDVPLDPEHLYPELLKTCPEGGCTVLDIGANKGDFIEQTLKIAPQTKIVAFEPHPVLSLDLERRFAGVNNVELHKAGLSISPGKLHAAVNIGKGYQEVKFIKSCSDITELQKQRYNKTCQTIPTIAFDDVVDFPANIMKIDVQGHELDALLGGYASFVKHDYDIILSELSPSLFESESHARLYLKLLASRGYRIYALQRLTPQFKRTIVEIPAEGVEISAWREIGAMRATGSWIDILCVRNALEWQ